MNSFLNMALKYLRKISVITINNYNLLKIDKTTG